MTSLCYVASLRCLTFEVRRALRQGVPAVRCNINMGAARAVQPAIACLLVRGVRQHQAPQLEPIVGDTFAVSWQVVEGVETVKVIDWQICYALWLTEANVNG